MELGWKIGIGAAVVGVGAWIIAALSAKPAKAATTPEDQPPVGGKVIPLDKHDGFVLVPGDMGTLTISTNKNLNARILVTAIEDKITNIHSSNPSMINAGSVKNFTSVSVPIMGTGEAVLTFTWTQGTTTQTSVVKVVAQ